MLKDLIEALNDIFVLEYGSGLDEVEREIYESLSEEALQKEIENHKRKYSLV